MAEIKRTPWKCLKCGTNKVETSKDPMDRLQPTLVATRMIGHCARCNGTRLFQRESSA